MKLEDGKVYVVKWKQSLPNTKFPQVVKIRREYSTVFYTYLSNHFNNKGLTFNLLRADHSDLIMWLTDNPKAVKLFL